MKCSNWAQFTSHIHFEESDDERFKRLKCWILLNPRTSKFLKSWNVILFSVFWFDMLSNPIFAIWPQYLQVYIVVIWICDVVWLINICLNFVTIKLDMESRDPFDIALRYI